MPYYAAAGAKMMEAKPQMPHGTFQSWVTRAFSITYRQARRYMQLAESKSDARVTFGSLRASERSARATAGTGKPAWHEPVKEIVNRVDTPTLNVKREELKRADEREAQRLLGRQLIDIGYKVLARELHPDKGGSREAMTRLNAERDRLKLHA